MATKSTPNQIGTQKTTYWKYPAFERFLLELGRKTKSQIILKNQQKMNFYKQKNITWTMWQNFFLNCGKKLNTNWTKWCEKIFVKASIRKAKYNRIKVARRATRRTRTKTDWEKKKDCETCKVWRNIFYILWTYGTSNQKKQKFQIYPIVLPPDSSFKSRKWSASPQYNIVKISILTINGAKVLKSIIYFTFIDNVGQNFIEY